MGELEVGPGLSSGTCSSIQLKNGRYPATERGNYSNREFPSTMLSGCQLNHMLPTWTDQLDVSSSQWGTSRSGLGNRSGSAVAVRHVAIQLRDPHEDTTVQGREGGGD